MRTGTWNARIFSSLVVGLLVLAGICCGAGPALAQFDCPLPAGVTPPEDPRVTAQQVENGSASLMDFVLVAKDFYVRVPQATLGERVYFACLVRQEGSVWRSGSTYLVRLDPDGRVGTHAKDMSLSGGQLNPLIYSAVLEALGINPADLTDPATAQTAFAAANAGDGAPFDVPGIPGVSGYATVYFTAGMRNPHVLLGGFDLDSSHLAEEDIEHVDPAITAKDVVDRETLKNFVATAGEYVMSLLESGGLSALSKAKLALRDPNGPWRHGPVYIAMLQPESNVIVFHGAFPNRFELRQGGISRDIATGELIVDQLVAAAESGPEGGFWLYYFDNPADETDSAEVPKVGYALVFTANILLPDGSTIPKDFIINSGFYLTSDGAFVQRILEALDDGQMSMLFGINTPEDGDVVAGDAVAVSVTGAPTDTVHFAHRLAGLPNEAFTYLGAATNREGAASFAWDTLDLPDDDYELVALYTEDGGDSVVYDSIEVNIDNTGDGGGGCVAVPVLPGGPVDPTLTALVGLLMVYLMFGRRRPMRQAAQG